MSSGPPAEYSLGYMRFLSLLSMCWRASLVLTPPPLYGGLSVRSHIYGLPWCILIVSPLAPLHSEDSLTINRHATTKIANITTTASRNMWEVVKTTSAAINRPIKSLVLRVCLLYLLLSHLISL